MHLYFECQHLTLQLTRSRREDTTDPTRGTRQSSPCAHTLPPYTHYSSAGPVGKLRCHSIIRKSDSESHDVSPNCHKSSRSGSIRKGFGRVFFYFSRMHPIHGTSSYTLGTTATEHAELPAATSMPELPGTMQSGAWELDTFQQQPSLITSQHHEQNHAHSSSIASQYTQPVYSSARTPQHAPVAQPWRASASNSVSSDSLPIERQGTSPYPLMINNDPPTTSPSTSHSTSTTTSPATPNRFEERAWSGNGNMYQQTSSFNAPHSYPMSPYGYYQPKSGADLSGSPVSIRTSCAQSYSIHNTSLPTPLLTSPRNHGTELSPLGFQHNSFEGSPTSSPSHSSAGSGMSYMIAAHNLEQLNTVSQHNHATVHPSLWDSRVSFPQTHRSSEGSRPIALFHDDHFDDPSPPYHVNADVLQAPTQYQSEPGQTFPHLTPANKKTKLPCISTPLLACPYCDQLFKGLSRTGNRNRHIKAYHRMNSSTEEVAAKTCRSCGAVYKRPDARRKHEWKKHRLEDCRPDKRRHEKKEKRVYMPNIQEYQ
ncbi:hypothetical protein P280DRAFT_89922 [Massarina eburnea CBS 473.64]|uniref:C2H2-type domain-containing protein n=1 Tax=Massarina eburnea CBS 473.64 TaxID=1395130 RepID=A0A6A6RSG4_9PLEO|nr:hypothetical protein P280DRAFT_89922 [Massarina eburnea CBS 473.64]